VKLSDAKDEKKRITVFVMGPPGTGKTVFGCGFPKVRMYDFDGKVESARKYYSKVNPKQLEEVDFMDCRPLDSKGTAYVKMSEDIGKIRDEYIKTKVLKYETCLIDSSTIFGEEMLNWLVNYETGIARNSKIRSRKLPAQQDYGIYAPTFRDFIFEVFRLPWNVVVTGHISIKQDERTGEILRLPSIPGASATKIPAWFDEVYVSSVKDGKYVAQTRADRKFPCRTQLGLAPEIELKYENLIK
jgi:hypothetical protein